MHFIGGLIPFVGELNSFICLIIYYACIYIIIKIEQIVTLGFQIDCLNEYFFTKIGDCGAF